MGDGVHQGSVLSPPSWCWKHFRVSSTLVCHGSFSTLMTWCSLWTPRRSVAGKGLCLNTKKTKFLVSGVCNDVLTKSGK